LSGILVLGSSGLVGNSLVKKYASQNITVLGASRSARLGELHFDLFEGEVQEVIRLAASEVFFCAAVTDINYCERCPDEARLVNVSRTLELIEQLVDNGAFVVWLSSSAVFNGQIKYVDETSYYTPNTYYGHLKMEVEKAILSNSRLADKVAIVRISKIISIHHGVFVDFVRNLKALNTVEAFVDLWLSPVSLEFVCRGLRQIAEERIPGIFHLSGEKELSYSEFVLSLANYLKVPNNLVIPIESESNINKKIIYRPRYPTLCMTRTKEILGLQPEPIDSAIRNFLSTE